MNKKLLWFFLLAYAVVVLSMPIVLAQDPISDALSAFGSFNLTNVYTRFGPFLDFIAYAVLFVGVAQVSLGRQEVFKQAGAVPTVIGIILAIATTLFAQRIGFRLVDLGPLALTLGLVIIGIAIYQMFTGMGMKGLTPAALAIVVIWGFLNTVVGTAIDVSNASPLIRSLWGFANILALIAFIAVLIGGFQSVFGLFGGGQQAQQGGEGGGGGGAGRGGREAERAEEREVEALRLEEEDFERLRQLEAAGITTLQHARDYTDGVVELLESTRGRRGVNQETWTQVQRRINAARRDVENAVQITAQMNTQITAAQTLATTGVIPQVNTLRTALRNSLVAAGGFADWAHTPAAQKTAITNRINTYLTSLRNNALNTARTSRQMGQAIARLGNSEREIRERIARGSTSLPRDVRGAITNFRDARTRIERAVQDLELIANLTQEVRNEIIRQVGDVTNAANITAHAGRIP